MTIQEQIDRLDELIDFVQTELPEYTERVFASDLAALIVNRVTTTGENYKGQAFKPYSTKTIPAWRFWGLSRTQTAERKVRKISRARGVLSYDKFREINNLKTNKKIFEFTGEMWKKFGVKKSDIGSGQFTIVLGGTTTSAQDKIDNNSDREGLSIIEASLKEIGIVTATTNDWLTVQADRIING